MSGQALGAGKDTAGCVQEGDHYRAAFLGDVSIPDNTVVAPGASFVKTWRLRNDGDCAWGPGQYVHTLVFANGDRLGALDEVPLAMTMPPGGVADISINMVAPQQPGTYRSEWMLMVAEGPLLGVGRDGQTRIYAQIVVPGVVTPSPTGCQDSAQYVSDDGMDAATYAPNMPFSKTWRLRNTGTCTWDSRYLVAYLSGAAMTQQPGYWIVQPGQTVAPGQTVDLSVGMTSPVENGDYTAYWGLKKKDGSFMPIQGGVNGDSFYVKIRVNHGVTGKITDQSIGIELEQGSGTVCTATSTYLVHAQITFLLINWRSERLSTIISSSHFATGVLLCRLLRHCLPPSSTHPRRDPRRAWCNVHVWYSS